LIAPLRLSSGGPDGGQEPELTADTPVCLPAPIRYARPMNERATVVRSPATYQDVLDAPPGLVAELIDRTLYLSPQPAARHVVAASSLGGELVGPFGKGRGGPGGWWILDEPELHMGEDVLVPDIAGWRRERMPAIPEGVAFTVAPDWVCEVLSPATRKLDLGTKRMRYAAAGVGHLWLIDPRKRTLEAFALRDGAWAPVASLREADEVRVAPFEAIAFPLAALWPD
jgi:Uma2 family endonuclease